MARKRTRSGQFKKGGGRRRSTSITRRRSSAPARRRGGGRSSLGGVMPDRTDIETAAGAGVYGWMERSFVAEDKGIGQQLLTAIPKPMAGAGLAGNTAIIASIACAFIKHPYLRAFRRGVTAVAIYQLGRRGGKAASSATAVSGIDDDDDISGDDDEDTGFADPSDFDPNVIDVTPE